MRAIFFCLASLLPGRLLLAASDPASLAAELRRIATQLGQGQSAPFLKALPPAWDVATAEGSYAISTQPLRDLLSRSAQGGRRDNVQQAQAWLDYLATHLEQSSAAPRAAAGAPDELARILARPEFRGIGPPSQWDLIRERIAAWLVNLFAGVFSFVQQHSTESEIFFWVLVSVAVGLLGFWLLRAWTRKERVSLSLPVAAPARTSNQWILAARAASEQGDFRKAIQCAYWAAIVRLEDTGALPRNQPHTPRECLRLISRPRAGEPSRLAEPLSALTAGLERHWYAGRTASAEDLSACFGALEALGCQLD
jgi:hypothetical protein